MVDPITLEVAALDNTILAHELAIDMIRRTRGNVQAQQQLIADRRGAIARAEARIDELMGVMA